MRRTLLICSTLVLFAASASAQKEKPWTEWTEKEAMKVLADSPWAQTQKELIDSGSSGPTITSAAQNGNGANMVMSESAKSASESGQNVGSRSASRAAVYNVSFLTAKPVRQAFIRMIELKTPDTPADKVAERRTFADKDFGEYVVIALKLDGDQMTLAPAKQLLSAGTAETMKSVAYLERKDGKRLALMDYRAPGPDHLGAKFIFPRTLDGQPFLDANSGEVRVYMEIGKTKLSRRFKIADMMYGGKLEY